MRVCPKMSFANTLSRLSQMRPDQRPARYRSPRMTMKARTTSLVAQTGALILFRDCGGTILRSQFSHPAPSATIFLHSSSVPSATLTRQTLFQSTSSQTFVGTFPVTERAFRRSRRRSGQRSLVSSNGCAMNSGSQVRRSETNSRLLCMHSKNRKPAPPNIRIGCIH